MSSTAECCQRVLESLELAVVVLPARRLAEGPALYMSERARALLGGERLPLAVAEVVEAQVRSRGDARLAAPAVRVELGGRTLFVRVSPSLGDPALEVVSLREEVVRSADAFRLLNGRHGVSRREYQVLGGLRSGRTNREIATSLGIAEATVGRHVHRLLERFDAPNRTALAHIVDQLVGQSV